MEEHGRLQSMGSLELDTTEWLHFHFSLSCIEEGNGNTLQCSCLENPRDREAWWAAVCGVAQSWTRLKRLSSSSSSSSLLVTLISQFSCLRTVILFVKWSASSCLILWGSEGNWKHFLGIMWNLAKWHLQDGISRQIWREELSKWDRIWKVSRWDQKTGLGTVSSGC